MKQFTPDDQDYHAILRNAMAVIPALTDEWTDFNPQDTGIMLLELMAALTETQRYYLDQVGERFFTRYLQLLTGGNSDRLEELLEEYRRQEKRLSRAVTPGDIRYILLHQNPQLGLTHCHVEWKGLDIRVYVYRDGSPLLPEELEGIREILEYYRLLTMRVNLKQVPRRDLEAVCEIMLNPRCGDINGLRCKIENCLKLQVRAKRIDMQFNMESIRAHLLSMPEVIGVPLLELYVAELNDQKASIKDYAVFNLVRVNLNWR